MLNKKYYTNSSNSKICYSNEGKGKVIVLLHGFLENMDIWENFSNELQKKYQVILIDLVGHGNSPLIEETNTMELMAKEVNGLLNALEVSKYVMVGHSMGAYVALAYAELYNDKLNGLGIFHSHAAADTTEGKINRGRAIQVVKENHKDFISSFIPELFTRKNQELYQEEISLLQKTARLIPKENVIATLEGLRQRSDKQALISKLKIPIMFILGKQDSRTPLDKLFLQIEVVKHAEVLILDDVAHMGYIESFDKTLSFVEHFVKVCNIDN